MPEIDGVRLLNEVRQRYPWIALLLLTGQPPATIPPGYTILQKPCPIDLLVGAIREELGMIG